MTLLVHELDPNTSQEITPTRNIILEAIRPHIYRHNFPSGQLKVQVQSQDGETIAESELIDIAAIGTEDFFHGYVRFYINAYLKKDTPYLINVVGVGGYSFNESAYCGVCNDFDFRKYPATYTQPDGFNAPLDFEFWERRP